MRFFLAYIEPGFWSLYELLLFNCWGWSVFSHIRNYSTDALGTTGHEAIPLDISPILFSSGGVYWTKFDWTKFESISTCRVSPDNYFPCAEEARFELAMPFDMPRFQRGALDRYATPPHRG